MATRKIFLDFSIFTSFINREAPNHSKTARAIDKLARLQYHLYTSSSVITKSYDQLSSKSGTKLAQDFLQTMLQTGIEILYPQKADLITSYRILNANKERGISLDEALNATLMQRRGIIQILTYDRWNNLFGSSVSNLTAKG